MEKLTVRLADEKDTDAVSNLYSSVLGTNGCTWNEYYPSKTEIRADLDAGCLYVLSLGEEIIGAASIVPENELDSESFWLINDGFQREIARVVVAPEHQGHGYAGFIVKHLIRVLKQRDASSVHLIVATANVSAIRTYKNLGFTFIGKCHMFGNDYFACEMILK